MTLVEAGQCFDRPACPPRPRSGAWPSRDYRGGFRPTRIAAIRDRALNPFLPPHGGIADRTGVCSARGKAWAATAARCASP